MIDTLNERKITLLDFLLLTLMVSVITLQPHFKHGAVNFYETGLYLPQINELFHGRALYRDIFVLRGPLEIFMPAALMALFGRHIGVLSAYFYVGTVLTLVIYSFFALKIFKTKGFAYLFTLVLVARTFPRITFAIWGGIRFGFGILAILLAVYFLRRKKNVWLISSGIVTGLAFWTSFELGIFSFISILTMLCFYGFLLLHDIKKILKPVFFYLCGNIVAFLPFLLYLFFNNAFFDYIDAAGGVLFKMVDVFDPALCYRTPQNLREFLLAFSPWNHNFKYTLPFFFYVFVGLYLFRDIIKKKVTIPELSIIPVFIYGIFLYQGAFRNIEGPQYRMVLQPLLLVMFFYLESLYVHIRNTRPAFGFKKAAALFFIVLVPMYSISFSLYKYTRKFFIFKELKSLALNKTHVDIPFTEPDPMKVTSERAIGVKVPFLQAWEIDLVVAYISSNTGDRETVFTFPDLGTYNFLTDRPPLGRFYSAEFSFIDPRWFEELMLDLEVERPRFVICAKEFPRPERFRSTLGTHLDRMILFLDKHYEVVESYTSVNILKIKRDIR